MREHFLIDPQVIFLNHGSFGATPRPVFEVYQNWQLELERQPVAFLGRRFDQLMDESRQVLAEYLRAAADDLIYVTNATQGANIVARSLDLQLGDEVLATDHEYGAVDYTWQYVCETTGACYVRQPLPLPWDGETETFVETLWQAVTPRTRVISISHITSPTALIFPVAEVCRRAREAGILTLIDGAHVPGQIPLDLEEIGADFYTGNLHKWLCAPKGAAFLYARPEHQMKLIPSIISWGWQPGDSFVARHQWQGTRDVAAYLSVPAAIAFQHEHNWPAHRLRCHQMAVGLRQRMHELSGLPMIAPEDAFAQMFTAPVLTEDVAVLKARLYDEFSIELPAILWGKGQYLRVSVQAYTTDDDLDCFMLALAGLTQPRYTQ